MTPQTKKILKRLLSMKPVKNYELNKICFRYGARLWDLRKLGYVIETIFEKPGVYSFLLIKQPKK